MTKHLLKLREKAEQIGYLASLCFFFFVLKKSKCQTTHIFSWSGLLGCIIRKYLECTPHKPPC